MGDERLKYLEMLQDVISRMADNEFAVRKWSVALGTAVIGFAASTEKHPVAALLAICPGLIFWALDAYYLALEAGFRAKFNVAAAHDFEGKVSFDFCVTLVPGDWIAASVRPAVLLVHLPVIVLAIAIGGIALLKQ